MKRAVLFVSTAIAILIGIRGIGTSMSSATPDAEPLRPQTVTVDITMDAGDRDEGEMCESPGQVIITDAAAVIVGTVDLVDVTTAFTDTPVYYSTVTDGVCALSEDVELPESGFYTFTIRDLFEWTVSADDLAENDWTMTIQLPR